MTNASTANCLERVIEKKSMLQKQQEGRGLFVWSLHVLSVSVSKPLPVRLTGHFKLDISFFSSVTIDC